MNEKNAYKYDVFGHSKKKFKNGEKLEIYKYYLYPKASPRKFFPKFKIWRNSKTQKMYFPNIFTTLKIYVNL